MARATSMKSLISRVTLWTSSLCYLVLAGCASIDSPRTFKIPLPVEKTFNATYEEVWSATQKALAAYPIQNNNIDLGVIETATIKGNQTWTSAHKEDDLPAGLRYRIHVNVVKGSVEKKRVTKVILDKRTELVRDFFSDAETLKSDGLEEMSIMYRIQREIVIDRAVQKAMKKSS
jgi:hypothetical protein